MTRFNFAWPVALNMLLVPSVRSQERSSAPARPQFEVASLKPNNGCENAPPPARAVLSPSPGTLELPCVTLESLIRYAYGTFRDGATINFERLALEGGPSWMQSEHYSLTAKGDGPVRTEMLAGPMLQTLLQDRFQLHTHIEMREAPIFNLTEAKGGLKVHRLAGDACTPIDLIHLPPPPRPGEPRVELCGAMMINPAPKGSMALDFRGSTMTQLAQRLSGFVGRTVVDQTGISGMFNFPLEFATASANADPAVEPNTDSAPDIFVALQEQIGLKLSPARGAVGFLIIDHVERPSAN